jgi:hypothetical protein
MKDSVNAMDELSQFLVDNPTLSHQRRALGTNGRMADPETVDRWIEEKVSSASWSLLEQIHKEIFDSLPQHEKEKIVEEIKEPYPIDKDGKPELTPAYLRSIGREDLIEWGTD